MNLRPYQEAALAAVEDAVARGLRRLIIAHATGLGKTIIFSHYVAKRGGRALILAHRDELIEQAAAKYRMVAPGAEVGIVKAERDEHAARVVIASVQTLARTARLARFEAGFDTVVVDECHHSPADSYQKILAHFGAFEPDGPVVLGVTATPERADGKPLGNTWDEIVHSMTILEGIAGGFLCDLRAMQIHVEADFGALRTRGGDVDEGQAGQMLLDASAPEHIAKALLEHAPGRRTIVFTPTVATAYEVAVWCQKAGLRAEAVDGTTPTDLRRGILRRLSTGETQVVANCGVLTEGFDEPSVSCIVMARPTKSRPLYVQMVGRGTRLAPMKSDCLILDVVGITGEHELRTMAELMRKETGGDFGKAGESLYESTTSYARRLEEAEELRKSIGDRTPADGERVVARPVDLFAGRKAAWVEAAGAFVMTMGGAEHVRMEQRGADWRVVHVESIGQELAVAEVWSGPSLEYAQGIAEDYVRKHGAKALIDKAAPWRSRPASDKQKEALRRWRVPVRDGMTAGEASDAMLARAATAPRFGAGRR